MRVSVFEGTPEEFSKVARTMGFEVKQHPLEPPEGSERPKNETRPVTIAEARMVMTRLPLSDNVRDILRALYVAGSKRVSSDELKKPAKLNADQFRGVMGALGRRVAHTVPEKVEFLDAQWDHGKAQFTWTLPESVRQAMRELKIVD
jgi:hypothetical protein